ncbi:MAG TPA: YraN family protein [Rhizomicrobium sp.]|nr:YraN family protein [Rhizomicrobium sp.]
MNSSKHVLASKREAERRGRRGETFAALLLMSKGYRILGRRVRTHAGEIDLIVRAPSGVICFVEVKSRTGHSRAIESLGNRQQLRIARAAELYLARRPGLAAKGVRFDTVTLAPRAWPKHIRDAWRPGAA